LTLRFTRNGPIHFVLFQQFSQADVQYLSLQFFLSTMPSRLERLSWAVLVCALVTHIANPDLTHQVVGSLPYMGGASNHDHSGSSSGSRIDGSMGPGSTDTGFGRSPLPSPNVFNVDVTKLNFSDLAIHIFKPSEVKFTSNDKLWHENLWMLQELRQIFFINNKESLSDAIAKLIQMAKMSSESSSKASAGPIGSTLIPSGKSEGARYTLAINPILDRAQTEIERRPKPQEKALGDANCGIGKGRFDLFSKKHIVYVNDEVQPEDYPELTYLASIERRLHQAVNSFTFFIAKATTFIEYFYYERVDECYSEQTFPTYTCHRFHGEDQIIGCLANGLCHPTYKKSTGHLVPVQCEGNSARTMPDMRVSVAQMMKLQSDFLRDLIKAPPTKFDFLMAQYRARRWAAKSRGEQFTEEPPAYQETPRETILRNYEKAKVDVPEEVRKLFYAIPKLYFKRGERMRKNPDEPNCGVLSVADVHLSVCPNFQEVDLTKSPFNWGEVRLPTTSESAPNSPTESELYLEDEVFEELGQSLNDVGQFLRN
jgi:hypothetical protein